MRLGDWFRIRTIRQRLWLGGSILVALLIIGGAVGSVSLRMATTMLEDTLESVQEESRLSVQLAASLAQQIQAATQYLEMRDDSSQGEFRARGWEAHRVQAEMNDLDGPTAEEIALIAEIDRKLSTIEGEYALTHRLVDLGRESQARERQASIQPLVTALLEDVDQLGQLQTTRAQDIVVGQQRGATRRSVLIALGSIAASLLAFLIVYSIIRSITRPLHNLTEAADSMAAGDMNCTIDHESDDEIGVLARSFRELNIVVTSLVGETQRLSHAAGEGKRGVRGNVTRFQGAFRDLIEGTNSTVEAIEELSEQTELQHHEAVMFLQAAGEAAERVAQRDLTARIEGEYATEYAAIQRALNTALDYLDDALAEVATAAVQVASASEQIAGGSEMLAGRASEQAHVLEEVSAGLLQLNTMTRANAGHAGEVESLADRAHEISLEGGEGMERLSEAMQQIKSSSDATARIVKTIDEIAFQTNLLALNAAVEAARAGEAGKGFAVVAEEVRSLAIRSAEAARTSADMIEEATRNVDGGVAINQEVVQALDEINRRVGRVSEVVAEIAEASDQQSQGTDQITERVTQLDAVTLQVTANAEESSSAATELAGHASGLLELVGSFSLSPVDVAERADASITEPALARGAAGLVGTQGTDPGVHSGD